MPNLNERIIREKETLDQLKRQKKAQDIRNKRKEEKLNLRRYIIIGRIFTKYFPEVLNYMPRKTESDNNIEFAPLINFLSILAADKTYIEQVKKQANQKTLSNSKYVQDSIKRDSAP